MTQQHPVIADFIKLLRDGPKLGILISPEAHHWYAVYMDSLREHVPKDKRAKAVESLIKRLETVE